MSLFNKKYQLAPLTAKKDRRNFITKSLAGLLGVTMLAKAEDLFAIKSKTGYLYIKQDGEVITNYSPSSGDTPFMGELSLFAFGFAPQGWAICSGQLLAIAQNSALFSLLGTLYGGNGTTTFALPDLRGRTPISSGQGPGLSNYSQGTALGTESVTLNTSQLPAHNHSLAGNSGTGTLSDPTGNYIAQYGEGVKAFTSLSNTTLNSSSVTNAGGGQAHSNLQPYLTLNWCIALQGVFPSQS